MRKLKKIGLLLLFSALIFGCDFTVNQPENDKNIEKPGESSQPESSDPIQPEDPTDSKDITTIKGSELGSGAWYFKSYDLSEYASQTVKIELSCKIKTSSSNKITLKWQINQDPEYPTIAQADVGSDWGTPVELYYKEVQNGLKKHADSITLGNELKPQFMLCWWGNGDGAKQKMTSFTASNGQTIQVPKTIQGLSRLNDILTILKNNNLKMRGHVLTWHSQTPDDFFAEGYSAKSNGELISNPVSKDVMTARHEWYIKTILEYVNDWEAENGYGTGNHIIWTWDVVNEAIADDATKTDYLRGSTSGTKDKTPTPPAGSNQAQGSRWYQIYQSDEFIVNAFRFANAYAPSDVPLAYNDYNEYMDYEKGWKTTGILNLIENIRNGEAQTINGKLVKPRIDVMGMQSHVGDDWPGVGGYEDAVKRYLDAGVDIHVSEFDIAAKSSNSSKSTYSEYFKMLKNYGKNYSGKNKITNVTIWGLNNEDSWIKSKSKYPLLFNKINDEYIPNASFDAVIEAAKN